ncbi:MAG: hydroxypyruvate isomerase, partial [Acidovorax sp.]
MPRFAANLTLMYTELPFLDRFAAAARDGFAAVELQFPYAFGPADIAARLRDSGLRLVLLNAPAAGADRAGMAAAWDAGARG